MVAAVAQKIRLKVLSIPFVVVCLTLAIRTGFASFSYVLLRLKGFIPTVTPAPLLAYWLRTMVLLHGVRMLTRLFITQ